MPNIESRPFINIEKLKKEATQIKEVVANMACGCCLGDGDCGDDGHCDGRSVQTENKSK